MNDDGLPGTAILIIHQLIAFLIENCWKNVLIHAIFVNLHQNVFLFVCHFVPLDCLTLDLRHFGLFDENVMVVCLTDPAAFVAFRSKKYISSGNFEIIKSKQLLKIAFFVKQKFIHQKTICLHRNLKQKCEFKVEQFEMCRAQLIRSQLHWNRTELKQPH